MFKDRKDAGQQLAQKLIRHLTNQKENPIILALPRGGVVVGYEVAKALKVPLDVLVVRKIGSPFNPEFAIGAIAECDIQIIDQDSARVVGATTRDLKQIINSEREELKRRAGLYRRGKSPKSLKGKTVIIVDDGLATGLTAQAAIESVHKLKAKKIILAVPVCAYETAERLKKIVDDLICLSSQHELSAIGLYYQNFGQVTDEGVVKLLKISNQKYE